MTSSIGALLLAAGGSSRLGRAKQFLVYRGKSLVRRTVEAAEKADCLPIVVVAGRDCVRVVEEVESPRVRVVENQCWERGIGSSICLGVRSILEADPLLGALVILVCDQPFVDAETIFSLVLRYRERQGGIVASSYEGTMGAPAVFDRDYFSDLQNIPDEQGAKSLFAKHPESVMSMAFPMGGIDIDTVQDYQRLIASETQSV